MTKTNKRDVQAQDAWVEAKGSHGAVHQRSPIAGRLHAHGRRTAHRKAFTTIPRLAVFLYWRLLIFIAFKDLGKVSDYPFTSCTIHT